MRKYIITNHGFWSTQENHCYQGIPSFQAKAKKPYLRLLMKKL